MSDEPGRDHDRTSDRKQKSATASSKSKDLSHVPCKFFKVGGCTAGPSCPFSHTLPEPGQKEHCAWFIKGNCKFGHKCALAHILPGQDLSMDRKNKKAAQQAAAAAGGGGGGSGGSGGAGQHGGGGKDRKAGSKRDPAADRLQGSKNSLLAGGSTAPTRLLNQPSGINRPPMNLPLKATISPSAPAPPLKDTDFSSFASLDEMEGVSVADSSSTPEPLSENGVSRPPTTTKGSPSPLPLSAPRNTSSGLQSDFGPIGSPPNARSPMHAVSSPTRLNGNSATFSPGTSPRAPSHLNGINASSASPGGTTTNAAAGLLSSSPFSAPGTQTSFYPGSFGASLGHAGGVAASLGSGLAMMGGGRKGGWGDYDGQQQHRASGLSASVTRAEYDVSFEYDEYEGARNLRKIPRGNHQQHDSSAVVNEEMEDFIPGSLTDLLTPEERSRRMSRSNSGQQQPVGLTALANTLKPAAGEGLDLTAPGSGLGHRHSRSVPAPSLLGDLKSIWADTSGGLPASPSKHNTSIQQQQQQHTPSTHRGTPSTSGLAARFEGIGLDDGNLSMSFGSPSSIGMMSPSNASAAFLPGFHQHYMKSKQQQAALGHQSTGSGGRGLRGASGPTYPSQTPGNGTGGNALANAYLGSGGAGGGNGGGTGGGAGLPSSVNNSSTLHTHVHGGTAHTYRTPSSPFDLTQAMMRPIRTANAQGGIGIGIANANANGAYGNNSGLGGGNGGKNGGGGGLGLALGGLGSGGIGLDGPDMLLGVPNVLSPGTTRALQSHAPGQSLPQGLAAGLSRIHALPPLANIVSPPGSATTLSTTPGTGGLSSGGIGSGIGVFGRAEEDGAGANLASNSAYGGGSGAGEWGSSSSPMMMQQQQQQQYQNQQYQQYQHQQNQFQQQQQQQQNQFQQQQQQHKQQQLLLQQQNQQQAQQIHGAPPGLPDLPTKLSYSAAAAVRPGNNATPSVPPGVTRGAVNVPAAPSGGGGNEYQRPAQDDDELFSMDGWAV